MQVCIDEAGHGEAAAPVDGFAALVVGVRADDAITDDGDIGGGDRAGDDVEQAHIADDEVGRRFARTGLDHAGQEVG